MGVEWRSFKSGQPVPEDAIVGGNEEDGSPLYIARIHLEDGTIHPGKYGEQTGRGALIGYSGSEKYSGSYDLLCGDQNSVKWHDMDGPLNSVEGLNPVEGGMAEGNLPLYVAHIAVGKSLQPGKCWAGSMGQAAYAGKETEPSQWWAILCHA